MKERKEAWLITDVDEDEVNVSVCECDAHTALTRGLQDYIRSFAPRNAAGAKFEAKNVIRDWADPSVLAVWPSIAIYTTEPGEYDDSSLSGSEIKTAQGDSLRVCSEFIQTITVDVWCSSKEQRLQFAMMIEDAFSSPVDGMAGFRLALPFYYGAHADYVLLSSDYDDTPEKAGERKRLVQYTLEARVMQVRSMGKKPLLKPRLELEVESPG